ncbi:MAG: molybdenum cofactor biosynthesis protein MoaE [Actinomycetota bacterium]
MFGALAEAAMREDVVEVSESAVVSDVVDAIGARFPHAKAILERCSVAVDQVVVDLSHAVDEGSEVAILPPMSGGAIVVRLSRDPRVESAVASIGAPAAGGAVVFVGTVRDNCDLGPVERLDYSAYDEMAESVLVNIASEAAEKWGLIGVAIEHGLGPRTVGDVTFVVACAAGHRGEAFEACRYVVDETKARAPIWKKEIGPWGQRWVNL